MPRLVWLLLAMLLAGCGNPYKPRAALVPSGGAVIPLQFDGRHFDVDVFINGSGPYTFVLDTGSSAVILSHALAAKLQLPLAATSETARTQSGNLVQIERADVASLKLGAVEFRDTSVRLLPGDPFLNGAVDGMIGFSLLWDVAWTWDGPQHRIILHEAGWNGNESANGTPLEMHRQNNGRPMVQMTVRDTNQPSHTKQIDVLLDTGGAALSFLLPAVFAQEFSVDSQKLASQIIVTTGGPVTVESVVLDADLRVGPFLFHRPAVGLTDNTPAMIGLPVLKDMVITFDRPHEIIWIQKPAWTPVP